MWSQGLRREERAELADLPLSCSLTVKDLLLSGGGGDLVSSPDPTPRNFSPCGAAGGS